jgi:hypothetical protein
VRDFGAEFVEPWSRQHMTMTKYRRDECVVFRKTKEAFGGLSNMAGKPYHKSHCRTDSEDIRVDVMRFCLHVKLAQHREAFGTLLLSPGP